MKNRKVLQVNTVLCLVDCLCLVASRPPLPVYVRRPEEANTLPEDHELLWDDGVAPEMCVDFDLPHEDAYEGLGWFSVGIGIFVAYGLFVKFIWFPSIKPIAAKKEFPYDGLREELGGVTLKEFKKLKAGTN